MSQILDLVAQLYKFAPQLIGASYDNCLTHLKELIGLDIIEIPSGTKLETWTVPDEWIVKEAWVKDPSGNKIIEWKNDLSLMVYSQPTHGVLKREELKPHLYINKDLPDAIHYEHSFYEKKWGFSIPYNKMFDKDGKDLLPEGEYEVFIDTEFKPGIMKLGVHTIKGKTDREVLLFAHIDHPYQANDNLAGVACLADLALKLKDKEHTIKIVFCPETIGSIAYALTQDISKVDFMIALDCIGTDTQPTIHWSYDADNRINRIAHLAMMMGDESFGMNRFRAGIGSDEYVFNDPLIGIPGLMITRHPYPEYHSSDDTPEIIKEDSIVKIQKVIENVIDIYEKDFIPVRKFKAPLFRSKYNAQTPIKSINLQLDYLIYNIDGKRYASEIIDLCELSWKFNYDLLIKLETDELIGRVNLCQGTKPKTTRKK
jgi:aminopeptidase-like protein